MRSLLIAALFFHVAAGADASPPHCTFRVHLTGNATDAAVFARPVRSLSGRDVFIEKTAWLTERELDRRVSDGTIYLPRPDRDGHQADE